MEHQVNSPGVRGKTKGIGRPWGRVARFIMCLCFLLVQSSTGLAGGQTLIATDPSPALVCVNGLVDVALVTLVISNVEGLYGAQVSLTFDPTLVKVIDASPLFPGVQITPGSFPYPDFMVMWTADNEAGTIDYAVTQLGPREPVSGRGVLATITFAGLQPGETGLVFESCILADMNGEEIDALSQDGVLTVTLGDPHPVYEVYLPFIAQ